MDQVNWVHRTMIVPAEVVEDARALSDCFGPAAQGMWTTALSPTGAEPATHYISAGLIDEVFAAFLSSPEALHAAAEGLDLPVSQAECEALLAASEVTDEKPFAVLARMELQLVSNDGDELATDDPDAEAASDPGAEPSPIPDPNPQTPEPSAEAEAQPSADPGAL